MQCSSYILEMRQAIKPFSEGLVQELWFCPECRREISEEVVAGLMEVEDLYFIQVEFGEQGATLKDLFKLRKIFAFGLASEMKQKFLGKSQLSFGEYSRTQADEICKRIASFGLSAEAIVSEENRDQQYWVF